MIYNALVRPYMDYGAEIWGHFNVDMITKLQKKCIRHVMKTRNFISHTNNFFINLNTLKFKDIITYHTCRLAFKMVRLEHPIGLKSEFPPVRSERRQDKLQITYPTQNKDKNHTKYELPRTWNELDASLRFNDSEDSLKMALKCKLKMEYINDKNCSKKNCPSCLPGRPIFNT